MPIISANNLKFRYATSGPWTINDVSLSIESGTSVAIVGESGSGKSVTMMSLIGLLPSPPAEVREGRVGFDGLDLLQCTPEVRQGLVFALLKGKAVA